MAQSTLIFQSTGPKHQEMRNFMMSNLVALSKTKPTFHEPLLPNNKQELLLDPTDANEEWIKKTIVKNLWYRKYSKRRCEQCSCNYRWNSFYWCIPLLLSSFKSQLSNKPKQDY